MTDIRTEFQALDRDELLCLCQELTSRCFLRADDLAHMILIARWTAAQERVRIADREYIDAYNGWVELALQPGKLTSARLAERERAERRHRRLDAAARRAGAHERSLWEQVQARWNCGGEAA